MQVTVRITKNYGTQVIYPIDQAALVFARIAGTRTLTSETVTLIKQLGYSIVVKPEEVQL